jgi:hypothetical protein
VQLLQHVDREERRGEVRGEAERAEADREARHVAPVYLADELPEREAEVRSLLPRLLVELGELAERPETARAGGEAEQPEPDRGPVRRELEEAARGEPGDRHPEAHRLRAAPEEAPA